MKWVPISYCQYLLENDMTDSGKLFCYLKHHTNGIARRKNLRKAQSYFRVSERTIRRWLKPAININWIGKCGNIFFIRSWQYLITTLEFPKKACYRFKKKDLRNFKTFCFAAVISYMARTQAMELERIRRYSKRSNNKRSKQVPAWVPMAIDAIRSTLNMPVSTISLYRLKSVKLNYIKKRQNLKLSNISVKELQLFRKVDPEFCKSYIINNGQVYEQLPDLIKANYKNIHSPKRFLLNKKILEGYRLEYVPKSVRF